MIGANYAQRLLPSAAVSAHAYEYCVDAAQRFVLFADALRKRGNIYLEHLDAGHPPLLNFAYETILDGRHLERPVNYSLCRVLPNKDTIIDPAKRPIIVADPRAGHGPGIGGFKPDSQVGIAMNQGRQVYALSFTSDPAPRQTLDDVIHANGVFIEHVRQLHPEAENPVVIGNCQAGWAVALTAASRPDLAGPLVLNGAPLSYWGGEDGEGPLRYLGGLLGGSWVASFLSDLSLGVFDGANLVSNFEGLNPANTYWTKQYTLFDRIDTEEERYLTFERWWNGYFSLSSEEIRFIVDGLFVGNKLEKGLLRMGDGQKIDLKAIHEPIVVFASRGDNITPPGQALGWIGKVYESEDEIRRLNKVIVYLVHEDIGHLGIFVSGKVARREHERIIDNIELINYLPPGLYEMVIEDRIETGGVPGYKVRYEKRRVRDLEDVELRFRNSEKDFETAAALSRLYDRAYHALAKPWVCTFSTAHSAAALRMLHPLRLSRYSLSDLNPFLLPMETLAPRVREKRRKASSHNVFIAAERRASRTIEDMLDMYRDVRDYWREMAFTTLYANPWLRDGIAWADACIALFEPSPAFDEADAPRPTDDPETLRRRMEEGGFADGVVRVMTALVAADRMIDPSEVAMCASIIQSHRALREIPPPELRRMVREQSLLLHADYDRAIETLPALLPPSEDLEEAVELANALMFSNKILTDEEKECLRRIRNVLGISGERSRSGRPDRVT